MLWRQQKVKKLRSWNVEANNVPTVWRIFAFGSAALLQNRALVDDESIKVQQQGI